MGVDCTLTEDVKKMYRCFHWFKLVYILEHRILERANFYVSLSHTHPLISLIAYFDLLPNLPITHFSLIMQMIGCVKEERDIKIHHTFQKDHLKLRFLTRKIKNVTIVQEIYI